MPVSRRSRVVVGGARLKSKLSSCRSKFQVGVQRASRRQRNLPSETTPACGVEMSARVGTGTEDTAVRYGPYLFPRLAGSISLRSGLSARWNVRRSVMEEKGNHQLLNTAKWCLEIPIWAPACQPMKSSIRVAPPQRWISGRLKCPEIQLRLAARHAIPTNASCTGRWRQ